MQDIDDFDPLDDILLSDEELHDIKKTSKTTSIFQKPTEIAVDDVESKEEKKKRMLAELFGTSENPKQTQDKIEETPPVASKSDWLDLKNEKTSNVQNSTTSKSVTWQSPFEKSAIPLSNTTKSDTITEKNDFKSTMTIPTSSDANVPTDRRKSESIAGTNVKKSKQRFKSLDLDLEFDFDKPPTAKVDEKYSTDDMKQDQPRDTFKRSESKLFNSENGNIKKDTLETTESVETQSFYIPSSGSNRRTGISQARNQTPDKITFPFVAPDHHSQKVVNPEIVKDSLPTWLEPKKADDDFSTTVSRTENLSQQKQEKNIFSSSSFDVIDSKNVFSKENVEISDNSERNAISDVTELKHKKESLKNIAKTQTDALIQHEKEIQNSAIKLLHQHQNNINDLMQIISPDKLYQGTNTNSNRDEIFKKVEYLENTVAQLQTKIIQQEYEKTDLQLKLEHAVNKNSADVALLEDLYNYKLQVAEEKENLLKKKIQALEEEYDLKIQHVKESEEEIIRSYKEKIKTLQEEHLHEMKYIAEYHSNKFKAKDFHSNDLNEDISNEKNISKELVAKEMALEDKQKELIELEEQLKRRKVSLESKIAGLEAKIEEFETKSVKEKSNIEQQRKDLKLTKTIFEEKRTSWEREKQKEKEYLDTYRQEIETLKENLLTEERKIMKEKFELSTEKARLDAIMNLNGTSGQMNDIAQTKAELQGTIEEVNNLKSKLEAEREDVRKQERRLKEESWKLKDIEQQLMLQNKYFQKMLNESETKREEGIQALKKAQRIESQMNERMEEIEKRLMDLKAKEDQITKEKIEISKDREILNKRKYQLDMVLPQLTYEEQLPFNFLSKNIIDPKIMIMKLKAENDMDSLFGFEYKN